MVINLEKIEILRGPPVNFSFLRDWVVYVCMATENAEMTDLIANYLVE